MAWVPGTSVTVSEAAGEPAARSAFRPDMTSIAIAAAVASAALCGLLMPVPLSGRAASAAGNLVHAPLFATLAVVTLWIWRRLRTEPGKTGPEAALGWCRRGVITFLAVIAAGGATEYAQDWFGRSSSWHDFYANTAGAAAGVSAYVGHRLGKLAERRRGRWRTGGLVVAAGLLVLASWEPVATLADVRRVTTDFPLLASFERARERDRWITRRRSNLSIDRRYATEGSSSGRIRFVGDEPTAVTLIEVAADWTAYRALTLNARVVVADELAQAAGVPIGLTLTVADPASRYERRGAWRQTVPVVPGDWRSVRFDLPHDRDTIDWSNVRLMDLSVDAAATMWVDEIRLED